MKSLKDYKKLIAAMSTKSLFFTPSIALSNIAVALRIGGEKAAMITAKAELSRLKKGTKR